MALILYLQLLALKDRVLLNCLTRLYNAELDI